MIEVNLHINIKSEFAEGVLEELRRFGAGMSSGLGVAPQGPSTADPIEAPSPNEPSPPTPAAAEATTAPKRSSRKKAESAAADEPAAEPAKSNGHDRAGIIEGLTKIYSKGDPEVRARITAFRDKHGADRLRDLKDEDLPAAAQLLTDLNTPEAADAI